MRLREVRCFFTPTTIGLFSGIIWLSGCAHAPVKSGVEPAELYKEACELPSKITEVSGSVWLKATSKEASGQFPATVQATEPGKLRMEVTNLLGGVEAVISVVGQEYVIEVPGKQKRTERGTQSWGGIPLSWATDLFLGRFPCPHGAEHRLEKGSAPGELRVEVPASLQGDAETFLYQFREWAGRPWPESLRWERKSSPPLVVQFKFDTPENKSRSPLRWEAKSVQGEVKVRWKDRDTR